MAIRRARAARKVVRIGIPQVALGINWGFFAILKNRAERCVLKFGSFIDY